MKIRHLLAFALLLATLYSPPLFGQAGAGRALRPDPTWSLEPAGASATAYRFDSQILGEERRVFVSLPPSHAVSERQYPLVVVVDGASLFEPVVIAASALAAAGHMPEAVIVGVENTDRLRDLSPPGLPVSGNNGAGRADLFLRFLEEELHPSLAEVLRGGGPMILVGHSSGGLFAHYAAATNASTFGRILALDAPMHVGDGQATEPLRAAATATHREENQPERLAGDRSPVAIISLETRFGWPDTAWNELVAAAPVSWTLFRDTITDETHQSMVWPGSYRGLKALFASYSTVATTEVSAAERLRGFDERNPADPSMPPPRALLERVVEDQIAARRLEDAASNLDRLARAYGNSRAVAALRADIDAAGDDGLVGPTLDELFATPRAAANDVQQLLGEWRGYTEWEDGTNRTPLQLSIRLDAGIPIGEFGSGQGPGHEIEYLALVGDEFHLGYMNRMRPRGMLMYEGTIDGDVFAGVFVLRGVVFRRPDGRELPRMRFRVERTRREDPPPAPAR